MRVKEQAHIDAILRSEPRYISKVPHVPRSTGKPCGHFERYTKTGNCVHCATTRGIKGDHLAPTGEKLMTTFTPRQNRVNAAVECYRDNEVSIARCCYLFSIDSVTLGHAINEKGLTRKSIVAKEPEHFKAIEIKHINSFGSAMGAFARMQRNAEEQHNGND